MHKNWNEISQIRCIKFRLKLAATIKYSKCQAPNAKWMGKNQPKFYANKSILRFVRSKGEKCIGWIQAEKSQTVSFYIIADYLHRFRLTWHPVKPFSPQRNKAINGSDFPGGIYMWHVDVMNCFHIHRWVAKDYVKIYLFSAVFQSIVRHCGEHSKHITLAYDTYAKSPLVRQCLSLICSLIIIIKNVRPLFALSSKLLNHWFCSIHIISLSGISIFYSIGTIRSDEMIFNAQ